MLLNLQQHMGAAPHAFQIVIAAFLGLEKMHNNIAVVHQDPAAFRPAFYRERQLGILFFHLFAHGVRQRPQLAVTIAGADDKIIGENITGRCYGRTSTLGTCLNTVIQGKTEGQICVD